MTRGVWAPWLLLAVTAGCVDSGDAQDGGPASGAVTCSDVCDRWRGLGERLGCSQGGCECEARCAAEMVALIDCLGKDLSQCHCESDDEANCEGGWKANEGPARCRAPYEAMRTCMEEPAAGCAEVGAPCVSDDCCAELYCVSGICSNQPAACASQGASCASEDCCDGLVCGEGAICGTQATCAREGASCASEDCCGGLACRSSVCVL